MAQIPLTPSEGSDALVNANTLFTDKTPAQVSAGVDAGNDAQTKANGIIAKKPAATVATVAAAIAAVDAGTVEVGDLVDTEQYSGTTGLGGNRYIVRENVSRPAEDGGSVIYCAGGKYLEGLFIDGLMTPNRWGADGTKAVDSTAVQAMIDSGVTLIELECREQTYKISGCVSLASPVTIVGKPSKFGDRPTIDADSTVLTVGSLAGQKVNGFQTFSGFDVRVKADIPNGIFDMRSCRNFVFDETVQITSDQQYFIGSFIRSNRSYQFRASCRHFAKGFALVEFGDETGGEVLDNISVRGSITHGNVVMQQRSGIFNCHNIDADNTKAREFANSDESVKANTGVTYLNGAVSAGATTLTVEDVSLLKNGALGENDLIYVGSGFDAEYVRVLSVAGNVITLDTPTRFSHSGDHNSSGKGQPVIFGAVFFTLDDVRGFTSNILHIESGFIGLHLRNMNGSVFGHIASTCRHMIVNDAGGDGNIVNSVSGGDAGWSEPVSMMSMLECSAQGAFNAWGINSYPDISASFTTQEDLSGGDIPFWSLSNSEIEHITRSSGTTVIPSHARKVHVAMTGNSTGISIEPGVFYKQPLTVSLDQNSQGFRYIGTPDSTLNTLKPLRPSMSAYASDVINMEWNGSEWDEISRSARVNSDPMFSTSTGSLSAASNNLNSVFKDDGLMLRNNTDGHIYVSDGDQPTDTWTSLRDGTVITPV